MKRLDAMLNGITRKIDGGIMSNSAEVLQVCFIFPLKISNIILC